MPQGPVGGATWAACGGWREGGGGGCKPDGVMLAGKPRGGDALWKRGLRWERERMQLTSIYRKLWFRPSRTHRLGSLSFGLSWFSILLLPAFMLLAAGGLITLLILHSELAEPVFRFMWILAACTYLYSILFAVQLDGRTGRSSWREAPLFPGVGALVLMAIAILPRVFEPLPVDWIGALTPRHRLVVRPLLHLR